MNARLVLLGALVLVAVAVALVVVQFVEALHAIGARLGAV